MVVKKLMQQSEFNDAIDLKEIFTAIWQGKWIILIGVLVASIFVVIYAKSLPNIYKSGVLLAPVDSGQGGGGSGMSSQFGGLAAMAGINVKGKGTDKGTIVLEILKSRAFIGEFINEYNLKAKILATTGWDAINNKLIYNELVYDLNNDKWLREVQAPRKAEPSDLEVYTSFMGNNLNVIKDKKTNLVVITVHHFSPYIAKEIVDNLVIAINKKIKLDDIKEANESIKYLRVALNDTPVADMQKIFYQLIEQQVQKKMLASVREQYVLKTIDPAVVAETIDGPKRALICIFAVLLSGMLSIFFVLVRYYTTKR